jgi:hypothetical protein
MRRDLSSLAAVLALALPTAAFADMTYNINGTLQSGGTVTGTILVNSGLVETADLTVDADNSTFTFTGGPQFENPVGSPPTGLYAYFLFITQNTITDTTLELDLPDATLTNYPGGPLCSVDNPCPNQNASYFIDSFNDSGKDDFISLIASPTPEPTSLALVLTGTSAAGLLARRHRARLTPSTPSVSNGLA